MSIQARKRQALDEGFSTLRLRRHSLNPSRRNLCAIWDHRCGVFKSRFFCKVHENN